MGTVSGNNTGTTLSNGDVMVETAATAVATDGTQTTVKAPRVVEMSDDASLMGTRKRSGETRKAVADDDVLFAVCEIRDLLQRREDEKLFWE